MRTGFLLVAAWLLLPVAQPLLAQPAPDTTLADTTLANAYRVFRPDGQAATFDDIMAAVDTVDVLFLGEQHDDPVAHYLEATLLSHTYQLLANETPARPLTLSLEMFERDVQPIVDEYLAGFITESHFLRSSRPWQNYKTDYKPMVEFAKEKGLYVLAANAPRRYVNRVSRLGSTSLDTLSAWARAWLPPLPYPGPSPAYEAKWNRLMSDMMAPPKQDDSTATHPAPDSLTLPQAESNAAEEKPAPPMHGMGHMLDAQAFWDAAMAYSIYHRMEEVPNTFVLHVAGSFHVEEGLGMPAKLKAYRPGTRQLIVILKAADDFTTFDPAADGALGDFIVLTDKTLPRSSQSAGGQ